MDVGLRRPAVPGEDTSGEPFTTTHELAAGATVSDLARAVAASGYLPGLPGDGAGLVWMLVDGDDPVALLHGGGVDLVHGDRPLRAPYRCHLTVHPGATPEEVRRQVQQGPWDGPGRQPPRTPRTTRVLLTRSSVHAGDDADAPHWRTVDLPGRATDLDLASWVLAGYGASVSGGSVWLLRVEDRPVAVVTRASAAVGTTDAAYLARQPRDAILYSSILLVGRVATALPDDCEARLDHRHREDPFGLVRAARAGEL